jgi:DNA-binding PucR family transcriptional regulator
MFRLNDEAMVDVTREFERQHEAATLDTVARRDSVVRALLDGAPVDVQVAERTLGYRLDGLHVACIAWAGRDIAGTTVERVTRELLEVLGARSSLILPQASREVVAWAHVETVPSALRLADARAMLKPTSVRLAIGSARPGVRGFARTKRQAELAHAVASLRDEPQLVDYRGVALAALLLGDLEEAQEFAAEELGGLSAPNEASRELRATLASYLETGQDQTATANARGVHRNTIMRRLQQIERQLPHPLGERWPEVAAALTIREWADPHAPGKPTRD